MFSCRHLDLVRIPGPPALDQDELLVIGLRTDRLLTPTDSGRHPSLSPQLLPKN